MQAQEPLIKRNAPWNMAGYQLDLDYANMFSGQLYEQDSKRFIVTFPGTFVEAHEGGKNLVATLGFAGAIQILREAWGVESG